MKFKNENQTKVIFYFFIFLISLYRLCVYASVGAAESVSKSQN
jgi:hypothetical protein